jgi:hypothetical protein
MALIQRADLPGDVNVRQEIVRLESLGGDVIVRGRMLAETMLLLALDRSDADEDEAGADGGKAKKLTARERKVLAVRHGVDLVCETLHMQVVLEDGAPMFTAEQWQQHGAQQPKELLELYKVAERLAGADTKALAKN